MEGPIRNTPMSASGHFKLSQGDASEDKLSNSHESASGLFKLAQGNASAEKLSDSYITVPTSDSIESLVDDDHNDGCGFKKNIMLKWRKNLMFNINNLGCATFGNSYTICGHIMEQNYKQTEILSLQQDAVASVKTTTDRHTQQKVSTYEVVTYESINRARKDIRRLLLKLGRDFTYTYNASEHGFIVRAKGIKLVFKLPPFSNRLDSSESSIKIDTSRRWFHVHNYDNYAYNVTHRHTQGLTMLATYTAEAVTAAAGAFSIYQGYKWYSDIKTTLLGGGWSVESILKRLQLEATDIVFALVNIASCLKGDITVSQLMLILAGYAVGKQMFKKFLELANNVIFQLVSADSSTRHTQGADPTTFAHGVISLIGVYFLGTTTEPTTAKSILTSIKSLGSTLLTVKTVEQVLIAIINSLPDVIFAFLCQKFPALGLYTMIHDDKEFKKYVEISTRLKSTRLLDVLYNSHNFHEFLKYHKYTSDVILRVENLERGVHYLLTELVDWYDTVYEVADKLGLLPGKRHLPYVLWLSGHPGIGKSTIAKEIATMMARKLVSVIPPESITEEDVQNLIFSYSTSNEFFDGYHNQPIFILNDYLQFAKDEEEKWLIKFVDTMELQLPVSTVDNIDQGIKGEVRFCSRFIIVTSNATYLNSSNNIISTDAFNRRRDYVCEMVWKEKMAAVDFDHFNYSWARFNRLVPHTYGSIQVLNDRSDPIYRTLEKDSFIENLLFSYEAFLKRSARVTDLTYNEKTVLKTNLKTSISLFDQAKSYFDTVVSRLEIALKKAWDYEILGIPLRYIMGLFIAGTGLYLGYKTIAGYITGRIAQSMSGDVSTRRFAPDRKPLQRVTMGVSSDVSQMAVNLRNNMGQITTTLSSDRTFTQTMWGVHLGGTMFLTPKHTWFRGEAQIAKGEVFVIEFKGVRYQIPFDPACLYIDPSRDLAVYNVFGYIPAVRSIRGYLPRESTSISVNGEKAFLVVPTPESLLLHSTIAYVKNVNYTDPLGKVYGNIDLWQYDIRTIIGDCGSPLIIRGSGLGTYFAGIHVAGDTYSGNAEIITKEFLANVEEYFTKQGASNKVTQGYMTDAVVEDVYEDAQSDFDEGFLFLGRAKTAPWSADKTEIIRGPLFEVLQPHTSEPAVLSPSDPRLEEPCSPILKSVSKYATPVRPFKKELMDEAFKIVKHFYDPIMTHTGRVYSYDDAINSTYTPHLQKIDLNTSAGYPWNTKQLKKKDLIDRLPDGNLRIRQVLLDRLNMSDTCLRKNTMFPYTLTTTLKDERVSLAKVAVGKTRTFMNFPIEYTILMRKYFDDFINYETEHAFEVGTTIGVNIYSTQWDRLHSMLSKFEYHLDGDFKAFDGTIRPEFFTYYARLVNRFYNDSHANIRKLLMHGCCFAPIFVLDKVYMKMQGNPSGSRVTTSFNSFVNRMYVVMSILEVLPPAYWNVEFFTKNLKIFAHGDDHLIGFSKLLHSYWGGFALRDFMMSHGIEYTSSKKDQPLVNTCPLDDCFYLKSHFVFDVATRRYKCGLQKEVIQEMVSWQRDTTYETTQMIVDTALRYAYFWGREYFNTISMSLKMASKLKRLPLRFIPYDDLENEYTWKEQLTFSYVNQ